MPQSDGFHRRNHVKIQNLANKFRSFRDVNYDSVTQWIDLFDRNHGEFAIKILDKVFYVDQAKILAAYQSVHQQLVNMYDDLSHVYFVGYGYAGSSGQSMLYRYKIANNLRNTPIESNFIYMSDVQNLRLVQDPVILFVDDFLGTGDEATRLWTGKKDSTAENRPALQDIVPPNTKCYLGLIVAYETGIQKIQSETPICVLPWQILAEEDRVLTEASRKFTNEEKQLIRGYCNRTGCAPELATGYGDTQSLVVFEHNCPNDSLPVLWYEGQNWKGLFLRR
jgi:hypothetical protein